MEIMEDKPCVSNKIYLIELPSEEVHREEDLMILSLLTQRAANNIVLYYEGIKAWSGWCSSPFTSLYLYRSNLKGF